MNEWLVMLHGMVRMVAIRLVSGNVVINNGEQSIWWYERMELFIWIGYWCNGIWCIGT